jgi:hypothetical protein
MPDPHDDTPLHGPARIARLRLPERGAETEDEARVPLSDLCRPVSAKAMPKSAMFTHNGHPRTEARAYTEQRASKNAHGGTRVKAPQKGRKG